jgi:hypothetical protein
MRRGHIKGAGALAKRRCNIPIAKEKMIAA